MAIIDQSHHVCVNRPQKQRVPLVVCEYHIEQRDRICLKKLDGKYTCTVTKKIMEGRNATS